MAARGVKLWAFADEAAIAYQKWLDMGPDGDGMMEADTIARAIVNCLTLPAGMAFDFVELRPNKPTPKALRI